MIRASKAGSLTYENHKMEDYRLWLSQLRTLRFSNIGSILLKLRKHEKNKSATHTLQDEAEFKVPYLLSLLSEDPICEKIRVNPKIVEEFIIITGREVKSQDVFKQLKFRQELVQIFDSLTKHYQNRDDIPILYRERIVKNLSDRKGELAAFAVASDLDTEMLKCLLAGG